MDSLWRKLPAELVHKIAWEFQPVRLTFTMKDYWEPLQKACINRQNLLHLAMADRQTFRLLCPLLYLARLTVALAQLNGENTTRIPPDALLRGPMEMLETNTDAPFLPTEYQGMTFRQLHERQLDTLLQRVQTITASDPHENHLVHRQDYAMWRARRDRSEGAEVLLTRLFDAWCARLQDDVNASAHLPYLPLDDLPLRLFRCAPYGESVSLDPHFLRHAVGREDKFLISPRSMPAKLLLQHLARMNEELKLFIWLHLDLLLECADKEQVAKALRKHGIADDEVIAKVRRWREGFFLSMDEHQKPDEELTMEVWEGLKSMPLLGAAVPLFMIIKFASMPSRDKRITDEELVQMLHRAMVEMIEMIPGAALDRFDYLVQRAPVEFGVAAFKRLSPHQRKLALEVGTPDDEDFEDQYQHYLAALNDPTDPPAVQTAPFS